jgi:hypothetical protein
VLAQCLDRAENDHRDADADEEQGRDDQERENERTDLSPPAATMDRSEEVSVALNDPGGRECRRVLARLAGFVGGPGVVTRSRHAIRVRQRAAFRWGANCMRNWRSARARLTPSEPREGKCGLPEVL